ncbi:hypothetical protein UFOVP1665_7 [uncultured Caudovirales phage]|uniref:Uncharacterized protein n=1 Tax=uncultured Caudovirales phage TaxID=2100421 RepID=A0A6J5T5S2_9CAUD|nr:hypothetical protein UFOVP1665_7 [uncultured Caudovirales phage]
MSFNLDNYEDVATRIQRFHQLFPVGRIETHIIDFNAEKGFILIEARAFREHEDTLPAAIDFAFESRADSRINQLWYVENCSTSAIGRVLGLLLGSAERPTRENMEKVAEVESNVTRVVPVIEPTIWDVTPTVTQAEAKSAGLSAYEIGRLAAGIDLVRDQLGGTLQAESPICEHGHRILKEGISPKNQKPYHGYTCPEKSRANQCAPIWFNQVDGVWVAP